jgi:L-lactate dehydrogenase complex protein LldE
MRASRQGVSSFTRPIVAKCEPPRKATCDCFSRVAGDDGLRICRRHRAGCQSLGRCHLGSLAKGAGFAMRISLFITCINDTLFPGTGRAVVRVLERLGHEVAFDPAQTCCGQMHLNSGYGDEALHLARRFVALYRNEAAIVIPSTSCTATIRTHYLRLAASDPVLLRQVEDIVPRVHEFSEFVTAYLGIADVGAYFPHRVTYHATCTSLRGLNLGGGPLTLLRAVRGIDLVDLPDVRECCGFGGTFAVKNAEVSTAMMTDKIRAVLDTGAEIVTAGDNSCLMHLAGGLSRLRAGVRAMHLAEILAHTEQDAQEQHT